MKHLLIVVMAISLFTACKDNKNVNPRDDRELNDRDRDRNRDRNRDDDYNNDDRTDNNNSGGGWTQANVTEFVSNCVTSAANGGMQTGTAQTYCDCMQRHIEKMYPNPQDAGQLSKTDLETPAMKRKIQECLGQ